MSAMHRLIINNKTDLTMKDAMKLLYHSHIPKSAFEEGTSKVFLIQDKYVVYFTKGKTSVTVYLNIFGERYKQD